jgi:acyl-coenzyme A thioesterase PaaI-like protein
MKGQGTDPSSHCGGGIKIPLGADDRQVWQERFNAWPAMQRFGLRLDLSHTVGVRVALDQLDAFHLGGVGDASKGGGNSVNGAIIAGMFDGALAVAGVLQMPGRKAATVDLSIKMFRPVAGPAAAIGWAVRRTNSMVFVESVLVDSRGVRCAQASGIVCAAADAGPLRDDASIVSDIRAVYAAQPVAAI